jgi:hypothetical protein
VLYRIRARVEVPQPLWVVLQLWYGTSPAAASDGDLWYPGEAVGQEAWIWVPNASTVTVEATFNPTVIDPRYTYLGPAVVPYPSAAPGPVVPRFDSVSLHGQGSEAIDLSCLVDELTIRHGRDDTTSQPEASALTVEISTDTGTDPFPPELEVGGILRVDTTLPTSTSTRFVGRITDVALGWEEAGPDTPDRLVAQVMATGILAELGRRVVGDAPYPTELDGARISRVMAAAGLTLDALTSDPGTVQILARDIDSQPALDVAAGTAASAGGMVWATRTGEVRYADANHRRGVDPSMRLDACDVLVSPTWARSTSGLVNSVSIGYGPTPEEGEQPRYTAERPDSIAAYGRYELTTTTELANAADATAMGNLLLTRNRAPVWIMSTLPIDTLDLSEADTATLLSLDVHSLVELTGLPAAGSVPTTAVLWVEGWTEHLAAGVHDIELVVSGYCRTVPPPSWDNLPAALTWDTAPPGLTWDEATCMGPQPSAGRWDDTPASLRWDQVPAATTWDNWT